MYEIFLFSGGVYRFDEFKEAVEDVGGMVLKKNLFHKSRGTSFLSDEVQVVIIIPLEDEKVIKEFSDEIKGHLVKLDEEDLKNNDIISYLAICDVLVKQGRWMTLDELKDEVECPCPGQLCNQQDQKEYNQNLEKCIQDHLDKVVEKFCRKKILIYRKQNGKKEYNLPES
jgi:hypothetical protein